jgi:hypothetical protein
MQWAPPNTAQGYRVNLLYVDLVNDSLDFNTFFKVSALATQIFETAQKNTSSHRSMTAGANIFNETV